jgi:hypothetical protein
MALDMDDATEDVMTMRYAAALAALILTAAAPAAAQVEVETDPMAWALGGHSLHVAKVVGPVRINAGTFGIEIPRAYHGNEGWQSSMKGAGVKLDWLGGDIDGLFAGVDGGWMRSTYTLDATGGTARRDVLGVGVRGGYRQPLGRRGLYVAPWVGVSYNIDGADVVVGGETFERSAITVFPTVHIGWRF